MIPIEEYILKPLEERQTHLRLDDPCIMRGGQSMYLKGLLAHMRDTTIPSGRKVQVCHACHNELCSNPDHLYWGTPAENHQDALANGKLWGWEAMVAKYGEEGARKLNRRPSEVAARGGKANAGIAKSAAHKEKISNAISNQVCYTNGEINIKQRKDLPPPEGFWRGMTRKKNARVAQ